MPRLQTLPWPCRQGVAVAFAFGLSTGLTLAQGTPARGQRAGALERARAVEELSHLGRVERSRTTGLARFVRLTAPGRSQKGARAAKAEGQARAFLSEHGAAFGLGREPEVEVSGTTLSDALGVRHVRFRQTYHGIPITGADLVVHVRDGFVVAANGRVLPEQALTAVGSSPVVSSERATEIARHLAADRALDVGSLSLPRLELFNRGLLEGDGGDGLARLAWFVEVHAASALQYVWVDAQTGAVLLDFDQRPHARERRIYTAEGTKSLPGVLARTEGGPVTADADIDAAYEFVGDAYDYFLSQHGRDGIDGEGGDTVATTHHLGDADGEPENAFWDPEHQQIVLGDGAAAADDIVAHEYVHGLTQHVAGLYHFSQSGALDESFADIFGETIDLTNGKGSDGPGDRWKVGEDWSGVGPLRDMADPASLHQPGKMSDLLVYCSYESSLAPTRNSGILNHAYALMVDGGAYNGHTVVGIGLTKAGAVMYRALSAYLTPAADMQDADVAIRESCADLAGSVVTSGDCLEVAAALDAVELGAPWACGPGVQIIKAGTGAGTITSDPPGLDCGTTCTARFAPTSDVSLTATPQAGSALVGWWGACSGSGACTVKMPIETITYVAALFDTVGTTRDVSVSVTGSGTVTSSPAGIDCGAACNAAFATAEPVTLTAHPDPGWVLEGWGGACAGALESCTLTLDEAKTVTASFIQGHTLGVTVLGNAWGVVTLQPSGLECHDACLWGVAEGSPVTLEASLAFSSFDGWGGDCSGQGTCALVMDDDRTVTATFSRPVNELHVSVRGNGVVRSNPTGIDCPSDCNADYVDDTTVMLWAEPDPGTEFAGWDGACTGISRGCEVSMLQARHVGATFSKPEGTLVQAPDAHDMVYDGQRDLLYITDGDFVRRYDVSEGVFREPMNLGGPLVEIDLSPDGRWLAVSSERGVGVWLIDPDSLARRFVQFATEPSQIWISSMVFAGDGALYSTSAISGSGGTVPVRRLDPATGDQSVILDIAPSSVLTVNGDGTLVGFSEPSGWADWGRYRVADGDLDVNEGGPGALGMCINTDATQYALIEWGGVLVSDGSYAEVGRFGEDMGSSPTGCVYHPDEGLLFMPWSGTRVVQVFDPSTLGVIGTHDVGAVLADPAVEEPARVHLSRDGSLLMVRVPGGVRLIRLYASLEAHAQEIATAAGTPVPITLSGAIGNGGALDFSVVSPPAHGTLSGTAPNVTYAPAAGYVGQDAFAFVASHGLAQTAPALVAISVGTTGQAALSVHKTGEGEGVVLSAPSGIACGGSCVAGFAPGSTVTLAAEPEAGSFFWGWSGACSGRGNCVVLMNEASAVTARFEIVALSNRLSVSTSGVGMVTSHPAGILCGTSCTEEYGVGDPITLTATPGPGSVFAGWGGACAGHALSCTVTLDASLSVTASFFGGTAGTLVAAPDRVDMVHDGRRNLVYISGDGVIRRYDVASGTFLAPFTLSGNLGAIDLSPDGSRLAVASTDSVSVWMVDTESGGATQVAFSPALDEEALYSLAFGGDGAIYTTSRFGGSGDVPCRRYDPGTGATTTLFDCGTREMVTASGDGSMIGFAQTGGNGGSWAHYRVSDGDLTLHDWPDEGTGMFNDEIAVSRNAGQYVIVGDLGAYIYDDGLWASPRRIGDLWGTKPISAASHPVESTLYLPMSGTPYVEVLDAETLLAVGRYNFGQLFEKPFIDVFQGGRTRLSRDGSLLMVSVDGGVRILRMYAPLQANAQAVTTAVNLAVPITLAGSIGNGGTLTYEIVADPQHGSLTGTAPNLVYTPAAGYVGSDELQFVARYGLAETAPQPVTINVLSVPILSIQDAAVTEGESGTSTLTFSVTMTEAPAP